MNAVEQGWLQGAPFRLDADARDILLNHARCAVARGLGISFPEERREVDLRGAGAFVTLRLNGELRGCRGTLTGLGALHETVDTVAAMSAFDDGRFPPVERGEWPHLQFEVSVLGPARDVKDAADIQAGRDGVLLTTPGGQRGFLLPQVMDRMDGDKDAFMDALCGKAGLPRGAWRWPGARLQAFAVEHFS